MTDHKSSSKQPEDSKLSKVKQWFGIGSGKTASIKVKHVEPHSRQLTVTHELLKVRQRVVLYIFMASYLKVPFGCNLLVLQVHD